MGRRTRAAGAAVVVLGGLGLTGALTFVTHLTLAGDSALDRARAVGVGGSLQWMVLCVGVLLTLLGVALMRLRWTSRDQARSLIASERRLESMVIELRRTAYTDVLTGLPNRASLTKELAKVVEDQRPAGHILATILLDLDDFKEINDTLGHEAGDTALIAMARRLEKAVRADDFVARLGGDEFVILCRVPDQAAELDAVMRRLMGEITNEPLWVEGRPLSVRTSAGVAVAGRWFVTQGELLRQADTALYAAKASGKNAWSLFDVAMAERVRERFVLSQELDRAIDQHQLSLAYQPIVDLATGRMVEAEALLRWERAPHRSVSPMHLVEVAESSGQGSRLAEWVLTEACTQAAAFHRHGAPDNFVVAVNMAAPQLTDPGVVELVRRVLAATGCSARWLAIELTETSLISDPESAVAVLRQLRNLGVHLSLDDFGTGYSSLSHLLRLPVGTVKVDRSVLVEQDDIQRSTRFLGGVCGVARNLGMRVLIEGVETPEQLEIVRLAGFHLAQGFLTGRPQSPDTIMDIIRDERRVARRATSRLASGGSGS